MAVSVKTIGGEKWKATLEKYVADGTPMVKVGIQEGNAETAGIAAIHEFGAPGAGIPARSFMRSTLAEKQKAWAKIAAVRLKAHLDDIREALEVVGAVAAQDIQDKIKAGIAPEVKPATIRGRSVSKEPTPLIDTGNLLKSISYEVEG